MTQKEGILQGLKQNRMVTPLWALREVGCFRLAARIKDLRNDGYDIITDRHVYRTEKGDVKSIALYVLPNSGES